MCLAVPGMILETEERNGNRTARVEFGGLIKQAYLDFVPEATVGDYVLVHVGFALSKIDPEEAQRTLRSLESLGLLQGELDAISDPGS